MTPVILYLQLLIWACNTTWRSSTFIFSGTVTIKCILSECWQEQKCTRIKVILRAGNSLINCLPKVFPRWCQPICNPIANLSEVVVVLKKHYLFSHMLKFGYAIHSTLYNKFFTFTKVSLMFFCLFLNEYGQLLKLFYCNNKHTTVVHSN